jgi:pyruvate kinase
MTRIRTKIVCTIGPASREPEMLRKLIEAGMDVARVNFSHGDRATHRENIERIRAAAKEADKPIAIMIDLQGPKLRVADMADKGVPIFQGEQITLTTRKVTGHRTAAPGDEAEKHDGPVAVIPVQYHKLPEDVQPGERILIDDGLLEVRVRAVEGQDVQCDVVTGGVVQDNKGLNLPGTQLTIPPITEKDWVDLDFAIEMEVDWVALSFVRTPVEVQELKQHLMEHCEQTTCPLVVAKIEKPQALDHIEEIIRAADGIMVARGDLGIEVPAETVPMAQKRLIRLANEAGKPVITATQMLDSMIRNPRPTRAEASDVANAILDGTCATMLSGETAVGKYPVEAVRTMVRIAQETESVTRETPWEAPQHLWHSADDVTDALAHATAATADDLQAAAIIAATVSGRTARTIAKYRPRTRLIAVTPNVTVQRQLMLSWGIIPLLGPRSDNTDRILQYSISVAHDKGLVDYDDRVVLTAGVTPNMPGTTNLMTVELVQPQGGSYVRRKHKAKEE